MAYDNTNTGVLFVKKARKTDKQPNFEGRINVDGKDYELAGWSRETKNGDKYLSLRVEEPRKKEPRPAEQPTVVSVDEIGDELPF